VGHAGLHETDGYSFTFGHGAWVQDLADYNIEIFGFVTGRKTYSKSKAGWKMFVENLEAALSSGWDDPENVMRKATLYWIDEKEEDVSEGGFDAIRQ
jgi:hypothetical protein